MKIHAIWYAARNGATGVALVPSVRKRPSWSECSAVIPEFVTGRWLGPSLNRGEWTR